MGRKDKIFVYVGEALARYGFGNRHPFGPERISVFWDEVVRRGLDRKVTIRQPVIAPGEVIERFHTQDYVERVKQQSLIGEGYLDYGDTPAFPGIFEAASGVVGTSLDAMHSLMAGACQRAFIPVAGLHHARRDRAGGFCVFNDCGVVIETLKVEYGLDRIAYVDIDAHHGDGVFYSFEDDPKLAFADLHEDGRFLYPGTGHAHETGQGPANGTKLNVPMPPGAGDAEFMAAWRKVEEYLHQVRPQFILFQCGVDSLAGDPLTHLQYSPAAHTHAAQRLCQLADAYCAGRILVMGGGGYRHENLRQGWSAVLEALIEAG
jgi:Deacetylases, including yeast histone deacetylase and acetoin utilization protein